MERFPDAVTSTLPALPLPSTVSLEMPVHKLPCPSIVMLPALTLTEPALPDDRASDAIYAPLTMERFPAALTSTVPALPVLPNPALLTMNVALGLPSRSMKMLSALILIEPALPDDMVVAEIYPPL